jgi:DNA topoisomerase-1
MLREAYDLLAQNAEGVRKTLQGALDRQHFVGPCARCGGALQMARSPRGTRWVQCVNNPGSCPATYSLPAAGFIEPAPEFLCGTCKVPRVKITFRGQRPDLYCINPECAENHKAFRIGVCPTCGSPLNIRYSFLGKRFVGCSGYPNCRQTYPLPQRGRLDRDHPPCPVCRAPVVTAIEAGRPPWTLCINPSCPSRTAEKKKPAAPKAASKKRAAATPPEAALEAGATAKPPRSAKSRAAPAKRRPSARKVPPSAPVPGPAPEESSAQP